MNPAPRSFLPWLLPLAAVALAVAWLLPGPPAPPVGPVSPAAPAPPASPAPLSFHEVLFLPESLRVAAATRLLSSASAEPGRAETIARRLAEEDPHHRREYGNALVALLCAQGRFADALAFARLGGPEHGEWIDQVYSHWAAQDPAAAVLAAAGFPGQDGLPAALAPWVAHAPAALADFAVAQLQGPALTLALTTALPGWIEREPLAALAWLDQFEPNAEFDASYSALARLPALARAYPDVALDLAGLIVDPEIRWRAQSSLLADWGRTDPAAVRHHLATSPDLSASERARLTAVLHRPPD